MRRCFPFLLAWALFAQNPPPPAPAPPDGDAALRERVNHFYQLEVDGKYREAEQFVAEDTKDYFYNAAKPTYTSFEIQSIEYSDDFTKATVHVALERIVHMPGFEGHPFRSMLPSHWKVEDGKWCWYMRQEDRRRSPFGPGSFGPPPVATSGQSPAKLPALPPQLPPPQQMLRSHVTADRTDMHLKAGAASSDQITLTNATNQPATLTIIDPKVSGLTVKLDHDQLKPNEKAVLSVDSTGQAPASSQPIIVRVQVKPVQQVIPIRISVVAEVK